MLSSVYNKYSKDGIIAKGDGVTRRSLVRAEQG